MEHQPSSETLHMTSEGSGKSFCRYRLGAKRPHKACAEREARTHIGVGRNVYMEQYIFHVIQLYTTNHFAALVEFIYLAVRITLGVVAQISPRTVDVPGSQRCGFHTRHYCHTRPRGKTYPIRKGLKDEPKSGFIFPASQLDRVSWILLISLHQIFLKF